MFEAREYIKECIAHKTDIILPGAPPIYYNKENNTYYIIDPVNKEKVVIDPWEFAEGFARDYKTFLV